MLLIHVHEILFIYKLEDPKHINNKKTKYNRDKDKLIDKSKLDISKYIPFFIKNLCYSFFTLIKKIYKIVFFNTLFF